MIVRFQDLEHEQNASNGQPFSDPRSVIALLDELRQIRPPAMYRFIGDNGFNLTVGIDRDFGCVEYAPGDGSPPYLMAMEKTQAETGQQEMSFVVGGTATPIDGRYRLPFNVVRDIVLEFVVSGKQSAIVEWEEF